MKELSEIERTKVNALINVPIPNYIKECDDERFDLMECYEIGFMFAHDLLKNHKIDPRYSPWGDGKSVIFDGDYTETLHSLLRANLSKEMNDYCQIYLNALDVFRAHFIQQE